MLPWEQPLLVTFSYLGFARAACSDVRFCLDWALGVSTTMEMETKSGQWTVSVTINKYHDHSQSMLYNCFEWLPFSVRGRHFSSAFLHLPACCLHSNVWKVYTEEYFPLWKLFLYSRGGGINWAISGRNRAWAHSSNHFLMSLFVLGQQAVLTSSQTWEWIWQPASILLRRS